MKQNNPTALKEKTPVFQNILAHFVLILLAFLCLFFFYILIINATRCHAELQRGFSAIPGTHFIENLLKVANDGTFPMFRGIFNSVLVSSLCAGICTYFSALTAYGLTVYNFRGRRFAIAVVMAIIMIPGQVTATGFYIFMYQLGWVNSYLPLIVPSIAAASTVFFFMQYLQANFQVALVEAARIDGAGEFYAYNKIIMPIMIPAMATMGIMAVIGSWNNYLTPLMLLTNPNMKTLPMMVKELRGDIYRTEFGSIYLGLTMTALPLIIVYFAFSKYIIAGIAVGGVKE